MTQYFSQKNIDDYREVFYLYANRETGTLEDPVHLRYVMRNTGYSPTSAESAGYFSSTRKMDFAKFLDVLHKHSEKENPQKEILAAFKAHDRSHSGTILASELKSILTGIGERLSTQEVERIFREAKIQPNSRVKYEDFLKLMTDPVPDYY